jgi:lipopolysaccharide export system protein LptA
MWTPKRVLLLASGLAVFVTAYLGYAFFLGGIDGLPALPLEYWPRENLDWEGPPTPLQEIDRLLVTAFGAGCPELGRQLKVETPRGIVVAAESYHFEDDGRMRLEVPSLAFFNKSQPRDKFPEINTIRGRRAYLTFDRPVHGPHDMSSGKLCLAELQSDDEMGITIKNNRRTPQEADDLQIRVPEGPLFFDDRKNIIYTANHVEIKDFQSQPDPTTINAVGMEVYLVPHETNKPGSAPAQPPAKERSESGGSVERIVLLSEVDMHLYTEGGDGLFSASSPKPQPKTAAPSAADSPTKDLSAFVALALQFRPISAAACIPYYSPNPRDHIHIQTAGRFEHNMIRNLATFDIPAEAKPDHYEEVLVERNPERSKKDRIHCEHLTLQFRRKDAEADGNKPSQPPPERDHNAPDLEIESARAIGREVVLTSDGDNLEAHGNEMIYRTSSPRPDQKIKYTLLRGEPEARVMQDGSEMYGAVIEMTETEGVRNVTVNAPGHIHLHEKAEEPKGNAPVEPRILHARWKERFTSIRKKALDPRTNKERDYDVLTFTADAAFAEGGPKEGFAHPVDILDDAKLPFAKSHMKGDVLEVWMIAPPSQSADNEKAAATPPVGKENPSTGLASSGQKVARVEASGNVSLRSAELIIHRTERLTVLVHDEMMEPEPISVSAQPSPAPPGTVNPPTGQADTKPAPDKKTEPDPKPPIELRAHVVKAWVVRLIPPPGSKLVERNEIDELWTEDHVVVTQAPTPPGKKKEGVARDVLPNVKPGTPITLTTGKGRVIAVQVDGPRQEGLFVGQFVSYKDEVLALKVKAGDGDSRTQECRVAEDVKVTAYVLGNGLFIQGHRLTMKRRAGGNDLDVSVPISSTTDGNDLARVLMDDLYIVGPKVSVKQAENTARVDGMGMMRVMSGSDFQGQALKEPVPLDVFWNRLMVFNGQLVEYYGNIQAVQKDSCMTCDKLEVYLDRPVSFKPGEKEPKPANAEEDAGPKVKRFVCGGNVRVDDSLIDPETKKLQRYLRIQTVELNVDNDTGVVMARGRFRGREPDGDKPDGTPGPGRTVSNEKEGEPEPTPGVVRIVQPSSDTPLEPAAPAAPAAPAKPKEEVWKLTQVHFAKSMDLEQREPRIAHFYGDVRVLHIPWDIKTLKPDAPLDLVKMIAAMPENGLYIQCEKLTVKSKPLPAAAKPAPTKDAAEKTVWHEMRAEGQQVYLKGMDGRGQPFEGKGAEVYYDEEKGQLILDGKGDNAELIQRKGGKLSFERGKKFTYDRNEGRWKVDNFAGGEFRPNK